MRGSSTRVHMGRRAIDRGECYGGDQIHSALDVEDPPQKPRTPGVESYSRNRSDGQQSRNQVTKGRWIGELWSYAGVGASGCQEHQAEVAESVQQQNREQDGPRSQLVEPWKQIDLGRDPEHQGAEEEIDREDIHGEFSCSLCRHAERPAPRLDAVPRGNPKGKAPSCLTRQSGRGAVDALVNRIFKLDPDYTIVANEENATCAITAILHTPGFALVGLAQHRFQLFYIGTHCYPMLHLPERFRDNDMKN